MTASAAAAPRHFSTVLLATDLTSASSDATDEAIGLAAQLGARLLVVTVIDSPRNSLLRPMARPRPVEEREERVVAANGIAERARLAGARATFLVWEGEPSESILAAAEAEKADLIVVGTRGRGTVGRLLGSVSDAVVHRARVPVLVVRPEGEDRAD